MITSLISIIFSSLNLYFPLLLTVKLISLNNSSITSENCIFLLNYWICFILVNYITGYLGYQIIFEVFKVWLFYYHGCLIINYYYFKNCIQVITNDSLSSFRLFETKYLNPLINQFFINNILLQNFLKIFNYIPVLQSVSDFNRELKLKQNKDSFLQVSINYLCYIDNMKVLNANFEKKMNGFLKYFILPPKEVKEEEDPIVIDENIQNNLRKIAKLENKRDGFSPKERYISQTYNLDTNKMIKPTKMVSQDDYNQLLKDQEERIRKYEYTIYQLKKQQFYGSNRSLSPSLRSVSSRPRSPSPSTSLQLPRQRSPSPSPSSHFPRQRSVSPNMNLPRQRSVSPSNMRSRRSASMSLSNKSSMNSIDENLPILYKTKELPPMPDLINMENDQLPGPSIEYHVVSSSPSRTSSIKTRSRSRAFST